MLNGELVDYELWFNKGSIEETEIQLKKISNTNQHLFWMLQISWKSKYY